MRHLLIATAVMVVTLGSSAVGAVGAVGDVAATAGGAIVKRTARVSAAASLRGVRTITGRVSHVRDGDTIVVDGVALRLWGLHAPELHDPGGPAARRWMVDRALGQSVVCERIGPRSRDRVVARCWTADGDLAALLIAAGLGRDCPRFSAGHYAGGETDAGRALVLPPYCQARGDAGLRRPGPAPASPASPALPASVARP